MDTSLALMGWRVERCGQRKRVPDECLQWQKVSKPMFMNGSLMDAKVNDFFAGVDVDVWDEDEKVMYKGQIVHGLPGLAELLALKKNPKATDEEFEAAAAQVALPPLRVPVMLSVKRAKVNKAGFLTMVCRLEVDQQQQ
jgi:hypothetical protein